MKKVAIKLNGTESHFFKSQGYLIFLGGKKPFTQWLKDVEYILIDSMGLIQATNSEAVPDDFDVIDPFNAPTHTSLNGSQEKTFPREMMVWNYDLNEKHAELVDGIYKNMFVVDLKNGGFDIFINAEEIDDQPTELDKLKAENEKLKNDILKLKELFDSII